MKIVNDGHDTDGLDDVFNNTRARDSDSIRRLKGITATVMNVSHTPGPGIESTPLMAPRGGQKRAPLMGAHPLLHPISSFLVSAPSSQLVSSSRADRPRRGPLAAVPPSGCTDSDILPHADNSFLNFFSQALLPSFKYQVPAVPEDNLQPRTPPT